jgi:hypothetical protein
LPASLCITDVLGVPHKDYSSTPLTKKLGIKEESSVVIVGAPKNLSQLLGNLPPGVKMSTRAKAADVVVVFSTKKADLKKRFATAKKSLDPTGRLWVAYPKKSSDIPTNITFEEAQSIGLAAGLVDNKSAAIDADWSGVQFVYRLKDRPAPKR